MKTSGEKDQEESILYKLKVRPNNKCGLLILQIKGFIFKK